MNGFDDLKLLVHQTMNEPLVAARRIMALALPGQALALALLLATVLWAILDRAMAMAGLATPSDLPGAALLNHPLFGMILNLVSILILAGIMTLAGRLFGKRGRFRDALALVLWMQFLLIAAFAGLLLVASLLPSVGGILVLIIFAVYLWLIAVFTAGLHGFGRFLTASLALFAAAAVVVLLLMLAIMALTWAGLLEIRMVP